MVFGLFRRKQYDYTEAFAEFSKSLTLIIDLDQLKDNVISKIRDLISVEAVTIHLLNPDLNRFEIAETRGVGEVDPHRCILHPDNPFVRWFAVNESSLLVPDNHQIVSFFSEREQQILDDIRAHLIFPLMVMNRITGFVSLGPKPDGEPYSDEEIGVLNTFLGQAAFAFENAYLYRQQKTRLKKMYRADRLATLGQLAAGAAHEIRNPLTSIRSTIQYLSRALPDPDQKELVGDLIGEVDRINEIIDGMLSFSRPSQPQTERTDLESLIIQTINLMKTTARKKEITVSLAFNAEEKALLADPSQLKQVFLNVLMNGIQAMGDGGSITVTVDLKQRLEDGHNRKSYRITFSDTGPGIPTADLEHVFDPFFTTKKDGTGLGLSISYGIIRQHGGDIEIESRTEAEYHGESGTTVTIVLPQSVK